MVTIELILKAIALVFGATTIGALVQVVLLKQRLRLEKQKVEVGNVDIQLKKLGVKEEEWRLNEVLREEMAQLHIQVIEIRKSLRKVIDDLHLEKSTNKKLISELEQLKDLLSEKESLILTLETKLRDSHRV